MRTGLVFNGATVSAVAPSAELLHRHLAPHSAWHSPVPYLFGGLAAMLALIACALLILACSYWKLSGYLDAAADTEPDAKPCEAAARPPAECFEEHVVVIMAGDAKPTFLATPVSSRTSSFADGKSFGDADSSEAIDAAEEKTEQSQEQRL